jgi:hypothetical protein
MYSEEWTMSQSTTSSILIKVASKWHQSGIIGVHGFTSSLLKFFLFILVSLQVSFPFRPLCDF